MLNLQVHPIFPIQQCLALPATHLRIWCCFFVGMRRVRKRRIAQFWETATKAETQAPRESVERQRHHHRRLMVEFCVWKIISYVRKPSSKTWLEDKSEESYEDDESSETSEKKKKKSKKDEKEKAGKSSKKAPKKKKKSKKKRKETEEAKEKRLKKEAEKEAAKKRRKKNGSCKKKWRMPRRHDCIYIQHTHR